MSLRNFVKVVKRDVLKKKEKFPIIVVDAPTVIDDKDLMVAGWSSYKFHYEVGKYMTRTFNAICSEAGVQCTVAMDPSDYQQLYHFKNFGDRLVRIEWNDEIRLIEPGESVTLKARGAAYSQEIPRITPLNNGV